MSDNSMSNDIAISIAESLKSPECALVTLGLNSIKLSYDGGSVHAMC